MSAKSVPPSGRRPGGRDSRRVGERTRAADRRPARRRPGGAAADAAPKPLDTTVPATDSPMVGSSRGSRVFIPGTIGGVSAQRVVVLAVVVCTLALTLAVPLKTYFTQRGRLAHELVEHERLLGENADLQKRLDRAGDVAYQEEQARRRLGLVRPGETPYRVVFEGEDDRGGGDENTATGPSGDWREQLWSSVSQPFDQDAAKQPDADSR